MKRSRLAVILLVLLALVCFTALPVVAELPWDADNSDGDSGNDQDDKPADTTFIQFQFNVKTKTEIGSGYQTWMTLFTSRYFSTQVFFILMGPSMPATNNDATGS